MTRFNMPVGVSGFEKLRERNYFYIDKTELIEQILSSYSKKTPTSKVGDELPGYQNLNYIWRKIAYIIFF